MYNILKENYKFILEFIANDFGLTNISALEKVYNNDKIKANKFYIKLKNLDGFNNDICSTFCNYFK